MDHIPAYAEFSNKIKPQINWELGEGNWIGIWGDEWGDLLGFEILKADTEICFEVWQPDIRATKLYRHEFPGGLVHIQFPAKEVSGWSGAKKIKYLVCDSLTELLDKNITPKTILQIPFPSTPFIQIVIRKFINRKIVCTCLGDLPIPSLQFWNLNKNLLSKIRLIKSHFILKDLLQFVNAFTITNHNYLSAFKKIYNGPYTVIPMGIDTTFWSKKDKSKCRQYLNLPINKTILFSSSRLNAPKQVDKLIQILNRLSEEHEFLLVVSGHGTRDYEEYLAKQSQPLVNRNQILFTG